MLYLSIQNNLQKETITYQCNRCGKKRIALIPPSMTVKCDSRGLCEFVDVHECKDSELTAILLFIDKNRAVRSQVPISSDTELPSTDEFAIPMPSKVKHTTYTIKPNENYRGKIIRELEIKDNYRNLNYTLKSEKPLDKLNVDACSELGFMSIQANLSRNTTEDKARAWLQKLADLLEKTANLDEDIFSYLIYFLDQKLIEDLNNQNSKELEIILQSTVSFPLAEENVLDEYNNLRKTVFKKLTIVDNIFYTNILKSCINNESQTILDIFNNLEQKLPLFLYLAAIYNLAENNLIEIEKVEFLTID